MDSLGDWFRVALVDAINSFRVERFQLSGDTFQLRVNARLACVFGISSELEERMECRGNAARSCTVSASWILWREIA
jgi:hypothetical protein